MTLFPEDVIDKGFGFSTQLLFRRRSDRRHSALETREIHPVLEQRQGRRTSPRIAQEATRFALDDAGIVEIPGRRRRQEGIVRRRVPHEVRQPIGQGVPVDAMNVGRALILEMVKELGRLQETSQHETRRNDERVAFFLDNAENRPEAVDLLLPERTSEGSRAKIPDQRGLTLFLERRAVRVRSEVGQRCCDGRRGTRIRIDVSEIDGLGSRSRGPRCTYFVREVGELRGDVDTEQGLDRLLVFPTR